MNDADPVAMRNRFEKLLDDGGGFGFGERALDDPVVESSGFAELEHHGQRVVGFEDVEELENVGVRSEKAHDLGLFLEAGAVLGISEARFVDDFAGDELGRVGAESSDDCAESAAADFFKQLVGVLQCVIHLGGFWAL